MDFPIFHLDFLGNRMIIASIAVLHVLINHACAVGAMPLITAMEWWGQRKGDERWDELARRLLFVFFIVTTTVGALTGVGIWFSTSLVNPYAIGSLIRIFFWAWFTEWIVFVTEVCLILAYFLLWRRWTGARKAAHIQLGILLSVASWLTMAIIVAILSFQMDPGAWRMQRMLLSGFLNPVYLPQLAFRTPMAMVMAGALFLFIVPFLTKRDAALKSSALRFVSIWIAVWLPPFALGALWYRQVIPALMARNVPVALATIRYQALYQGILTFIVAAVAALVCVALWGWLKPGRLPRWAWALPAILVVVLVGQFERTREFIRKPYIIGGYLYANGIRVSDYPMLARDGILRHSEFVSVGAVTPENRLEAGKAVFMVACSRCHTLGGVNNLPDRLRGLYGTTAWDEKAIDRFLATMHGARPFMPPFPGSAQEREALAAYLAGLQTKPDTADGAQTVGIPPRSS